MELLIEFKIGSNSNPIGASVNDGFVSSLSENEGGEDKFILEFRPHRGDLFVER
jgi:hypothetical protein